MPFEVGQPVGLGDVTIMVDAFHRRGEIVTATVDVGNVGSHALTVVPATDFAIFYGAALHPPVRAGGVKHPIAPNRHGTATFEFRVPTEFGFPLLWFRGSIPGTRVGTVVLRGNGS